MMHSNHLLMWLDLGILILILDFQTHISTTAALLGPACGIRPIQLFLM